MSTTKKTSKSGKKLTVSKTTVKDLAPKKANVRGGASAPATFTCKTCWVPSMSL